MLGVWEDAVTGWERGKTHPFPHYVVPIENRNDLERAHAKNQMMAMLSTVIIVFLCVLHVTCYSDFPNNHPA